MEQEVTGMLTVKRSANRMRRGAVALLCAGSMLPQFSGCSLNDITLTQTINSRDLLINLIRGAILSPLDQLVTTAVNNAFDNNDDE